MFDERFREHEDYEFTARLAFHVPFVFEARARGNLGLADDLAMVGEFDRMREYMNAGLHMLPRLLDDNWASELITRMAGRLAGVSQNPIASVRAFCADVRDAVGNAAFRRRLRLFELLGEIWKAAAIQLSVAARYRQAGYAAIRAMLYNPGNVNSALLGLMARGFLSPRAYAVLALVKHIVSKKL